MAHDYGEEFFSRTIDGITYRLYARQEEIRVRGNALVSGDADTDKRCEDRILKRLDRGDIWTWAAVTVTAELDGLDGLDVTGTDHLGACSYASWKQFVRHNDYWKDMREGAKTDLFNKLTALVEIARSHISEVTR